METKKTKVSSNEIYSVIDLSDELDGLSEADKKQLREEIGEILVEEILASVADRNTPIQGAPAFKKLSKEYKKFKLEETGSGEPNLDLTGDLISSIDYKVEGNSLKLGVFDPENAGKADGHNNFSGKSNLPERRFLPKEGETFKKSIRDLIAETVENYKADAAELDEKKLDKIESKTELYKYLKDELGIESRAAINRAVLGSKQLVKLLDEYDLLDMIDG